MLALFEHWTNSDYYYLHYMLLYMLDKIFVFSCLVAMIITITPVLIPSATELSTSPSVIFLDIQRFWRLLFLSLSRKIESR
jgi:hypothetical protein